MSEKEGAAIDPRYDPAFQRGFSGQVQTGSHGQSALRRTAAINPVPVRQGPPPRADASGFAPSPADYSLPLREGQDGSDSGAPGAAAATGEPPVAVGASAPVPTARELARNPFVIGLAVLAVVLILAGAVWAYEGFAMIVKNGGTRNEVEFWAAQTMSFGAPLAIVVGLAVAAVLLVLFARSWSRARD